MFMNEKMMECMKGGTSKEEKMKMMGKMMEQFFAQEKSEGDGKEEKKGEETACCPDINTVPDFCAQMMEQFAGRTKGEAETDKEKTPAEKKTDKDECCPDMSKAADVCSRMMAQFLNHTKGEGKEKEKSCG